MYYPKQEVSEVQSTTIIRTIEEDM